MIPRPKVLALVLLLPCAACAVAPEVGVTQATYDPRPQEVKWFHSGWYAGATIGSAIADASASDIDRDLAARGYDTSTSLDDTDLGWKVFGGYRFDQPWAIELAIVDLGLVESLIDSDTASAQFLADVADVHPYSGAGLALTGTYYPIQAEHFDLGVKAGLWYWDAEVEADAATGERGDIDESKIDPVIGLVGLIDLGGNFSARLEWEHYFLDHNDVDYIAVGIQYSVLD